MPESIYPNPNSPFYCDKDLLNDKLTWRLYDQSTGNLILRGFYNSDGGFNIAHRYTSSGTGMVTDPWDDLKNSKLEMARNFLRSKGMLSYGYRIVRGAENILGKDGALTGTWNELLNSSSIISQSDLSRLYESTEISIPSISQLSTVIFTESESETCISIWEDIYDRYFLGNFNTSFINENKQGEDGDGGYWTAPNNIDMTNNPLSKDELSGGFRLSTSSYEFTDLLLESVSWVYSREYAVVGSLNNPIKLNAPAYVKVNVNLGLYKYQTKDSLKSIYKYNR